MRIALTVTLDVDPETWAAEYGVEATSAAVRADALTHVTNTMHEHYVTDLGIAREITVRAGR